MSDAREIYDDVISAIEDEEITDSEDYFNWLDDRLDGALVYDWEVFDYLQESPNRNAYFEEMGSVNGSNDPCVWRMMAVWALRRDVEDEIGDIEELIEEHKPGEGRCAGCGDRIDDADLKVTTEDGVTYDLGCVPESAQCERCPVCKEALSDTHYNATQRVDVWYCHDCLDLETDSPAI